jgi:hypothetical protein
VMNRLRSPWTRGCRRTLDLRCADLQELFVRRDEAVLPFSLPRDELADLDLPLRLRQLTNAVATAREHTQINYQQLPPL